MPRQAKRFEELDRLSRERPLTEKESRQLERAIKNLCLPPRQLAMCFTPALPERRAPRRLTWQELDEVSRRRALTPEESLRLERSLYAKG